MTKENKTVNLKDKQLEKVVGGDVTSANVVGYAHNGVKCSSGVQVGGTPSFSGFDIDSTTQQYENNVYKNTVRDDFDPKIK